MDRHYGFPLLRSSMPQQIAFIQQLALGVKLVFRARTHLPVKQVWPDLVKKGNLLLLTSRALSVHERSHRSFGRCDFDGVER